MNSAFNKPSSVADLIGYSVKLARDNARTCIRILMWPTLIELIGKIIILVGINTMINASHENMFAVAGGILTSMIGGAIGMGAEFFLTLRQLALFRLVAGYDSNFQSAYKFVWQRKFQLLAAMAGTYVLTTVAITFWAIEIGISISFMTNKVLIFFAFISACVGIFFVLLSLLLSMLPIMLLAPALAIEERPFSAMVGWSIKTSFKTILRSTGFFILIAAVLFILSSVLNIPPSIVSLLEFANNYMGSHPVNKTPNLYIQIFASVWRSGANMVLSPMLFFGFGFYYLDLRMRTEGLDIVRRIESLTKASNSVDVF